MQIERVAVSNDGLREVGLFLLDHFAPEVSVGPLRTMNIASDRAYEYIRFILEKGAAWVARVDGEIVGSLGIFPDTFWWTDVRHYGDGWFYVRPEHRTGKASRRMLREAEAFADDTPLILTITNSADLDRKGALYERAGFQRVGSIFLRT